MLASAAPRSSGCVTFWKVEASSSSSLQPTPFCRDERHADGRVVEGAAKHLFALLQSGDALLELAHLRNRRARIFQVSAVSIVRHGDDGRSGDGRVEADDADQFGD